MKISLNIACAQSRVVLLPAACSRMPILKAGKVVEKIQGFSTARSIPQRRSHFVGVMSQDSSEAQCPKREDHLHDEVGDEHAGIILSLRPDNIQGCDEAMSSVQSHGRTLEHADSAVVSRLPSSNDGRVEELAKVVETLSQSLFSVLEQLETLVRLKETLNGSGRDSHVIDRMRQSAMRREGLKPMEEIGPSVTGDGGRAEKDPEFPISRMESRKRMQKRGPQRIFTGTLSNKRQNVKVNEDRAAINKIREDDERFMGAALVEAKRAAMAGEVPVGAVIVQKGKIIARAYNRGEMRDEQGCGGKFPLTTDPARMISIGFVLNSCRVESNGDPTAHAEMLCLRSAARHHGDWRLMDATLYVTLEPCPMCAGAILQSRVKGVVWGSRNTLLGADGSWVSLFPELVEEEMGVESINPEHEPCNRPFAHPFHTSLEVRREVLADDCSTVMRSFFKARRKVNKKFVKTKPWWLPLPAWMLFKRILHWLSFMGKV